MSSVEFPWPVSAASHPFHDTSVGAALRGDADAAVDIALLLEGTFPYVSGGVSAWVEKIIRAFPQYRFAVVFIGGRREDYGPPVYELPDNIVHFEAHFIHEPAKAPPVRACRGSRQAFADIGRLHEAFRNAGQGDPGDSSPGCPHAADLMRRLLPVLGPGRAVDEAQFLYAQRSWDLITERYREASTDPSFTDYFWTVRTLHAPLWQLIRVSRGLVSAKVYHAVSTGYAGFLGALMRLQGRGHFLISEHGIYTKERKIDLLQSPWVRDNRGLLEKDINSAGYFHRLWIRFFESLGRLAYQAADDVVSLFEENRQQQIRDGAPGARTRVIPNGIAVARFEPLRALRPKTIPPVVAFIGRIVSIKDVKTLIRAVFMARHKMPELQGWIIGPDDEDPQYALECRDLVVSLGLQDHVRFLGMQRIDDFLPQVGLVALSSISEGLPLVVLEAFAAGVPVVTTDVGACRSLVYGQGKEDSDLGQAGAVVPIANPSRLAGAMVGLLSDPARWHAAQTSAIERVERLYTAPMMIDRYQRLYDKALAADVRRREPAFSGEIQWQA